MNTGRILKTGLAIGVVANIYDFLVNSYIMPMFGPTPSWMIDMASMNITWLVIADLVFGLVIAWFFDRVRGSYAAGRQGGIAFGFTAGILMNFPLWIFMHLVVKDWSYATSWVWTINGIVFMVIAGAVAGMVYDMGAQKAAA